MEKPRIKIRQDQHVAGIYWMIPKTPGFWTVQITPHAMANLEGFADMLERIGATLVLRNLRDCFYIK